MKKRTVIAIIITIITIIATNKYWFIIKPSMNFDFMLFVIIAILTFLLAYKLSNYVAEFNTIKGKLRVDILFLTIFFIFLFIPMSHINQNDISQQENRTLAKWKPFISNNNKINFEFGNNFNEWFNDRFNLRNIFIGVYHSIKYNLSTDYYSANKRVANKKSGLILYESMDYGLLSMPSQNQLDNYILHLNHFNEFIKNKKIKTCILIIPRKASFYLPKDYSYINLPKDNIEVVIDYIRNHTTLPVIYPKKELLDVNIKNPVFFLTDPHMTNSGVYRVYNAIASAMNLEKIDTSTLSNYRNNKVLHAYNRPKCNFYEGDMARDLFGRLNKKQEKIFLKLDYLYYSKDNAYFKQKESNWSETYYNKNGVDKKILLFGNSFSRSLVMPIATKFKNLKRVDIRVQNSNINIKNEINEYKPDVIIFVIHANYIDRLIYLLSKEF